MLDTWFYDNTLSILYIKTLYNALSYETYYDGDKIVLGPNYKNIQLSQAISNEFKNHFENRSKELKELLFYRGKNYEKAEVKERKHFAPINKVEEHIYNRLLDDISYKKIKIV